MNNLMRRGGKYTALVIAQKLEQTQSVQNGSQLSASQSVVRRRHEHTLQRSKSKLTGCLQ